MTFACRVNTLREDYTVWKKYCGISRNPKDFHAHITLTQNHFSDMLLFIPRLKSRKGEFKIMFKNWITHRKVRKLISSIPAYATHTDIQWLAPLMDWESYI
jgi:2'-5' RNA ligase